jgi:hypothetical protein
MLDTYEFHCGSEKRTQLGLALKADPQRYLFQPFPDGSDVERQSPPAPRMRILNGWCIDQRAESFRAHQRV